MNKKEIARQKAIEAMKSMSARAAELGLTDMSLDEINAEIDATRRERDRLTASSLMIRTCHDELALDARYCDCRCN